MKITQSEVAAFYADLIIHEVKAGESMKWSVLNALIQHRWPSPNSLDRVKVMAWKIVEKRKAKI